MVEQAEQLAKEMKKIVERTKDRILKNEYEEKETPTLVYWDLLENKGDMEIGKDVLCAASHIDELKEMLAQRPCHSRLKKLKKLMTTVIGEDCKEKKTEGKKRAQQIVKRS